MKKNFLFIPIVILGALLRFIGIYPGYPPHTDEAAFGSALTMILSRNLDPARYDYPSAVALIHYFIFQFVIIPLGWLRFLLENLGKIWDGYFKLPLAQVDYERVFQLTILGPQQINTMYWGRYITAGFGVGIIIMSYFLAKKIFDKKVALISSFLVAVNYRQVLNSHLGLQDIYNGFFLLLTVYFLYKLIEKPTKKNYFLTGLFNAIFFSVKFQIFGFVAFAAAHFLTVINKSLSFQDKIKKIFFTPNLYIGILTSLLFIVLINPYHLMNFKLFIETQIYVFSKYGGGADTFNAYPISYLFHIGIGSYISIFVVLGMFLSLIKNFKKSLIINIVIFQSLLTFIYLTRGGFYTRNFITITPFLLILAALAISNIFDFIFRYLRFRLIYALAITIFVILISLTNIKNSYIVVRQYSTTWNQKVLAEWVSKNIAEGARVSAHPNTPLPVAGVTRFIYEPDVAFSIDEFAQYGSEFAISNSSWTTNSFYWWMGGDPGIFLKHFWNKPVDILEYSYPALAARELEQFALYSVSKPWQSPDVSFLVAKIPKYKVGTKIEIASFEFDKDTDGWAKQGKFWVNNDNLDWKQGTLVVSEEPSMLPSIRWESLPIEISGWKGFEIDYSIKSESDRKDLRTGYVFTSFYRNLEDVKNSRNRVGVRLSARNLELGKWVQSSLVGEIPEGAKYMAINFYNYAPSVSETELNWLKVYKADVAADFEGFKLNPVKIDPDEIFPNSHGNL